MTRHRILKRTLVELPKIELDLPTEEQLFGRD